LGKDKGLREIPQPLKIKKPWALGADGLMLHVTRMTYVERTGSVHPFLPVLRHQLPFRMSMFFIPRM